MNTRPRKWVKIATVDELGFGSFGPYVPFNQQANKFPAIYNIKRIVVRKGGLKRGRKTWVIWGVQE